jgi:hypothetical protein
VRSFGRGDVIASLKRSLLDAQFEYRAADIQRDPILIATDPSPSEVWQLS